MATRTVTFLLTDIAGSTRLWQKDADAMAAAIQRHDELVKEAIRQSGGTVLTERGEGDSFFAVFPGVTNAFAAAVLAQKRMQAERWLKNAALKIRIAIHTGEVRPDYRGPDVNRCARLRSLAHGGQILVTAVTASLGRHHLRGGASLEDLGRYRLRDVHEPEHIFQLNHPGLRTDFPRLSHAVTPEPVPAPAVPAPLSRPARLGLPSRRTLMGIAGVGLAIVAVGAAVSLIQGITAGPTITTLPTGGRTALARPYALAVDGMGNLYIADAEHSEIQKLDAAGRIVTVAGDRGLVPQLPCTPAGLPENQECTLKPLGDGKPAREARLALAAGIALDAQGLLYIADTNNHRVRRVGSDGVITTVAGTGASGFSGDGGPAVDARLSGPRSLALDAQGNLYIADIYNGRVRRLEPNGTIKTIAGGGSGGISDGDPATQARLEGEFSIAADAEGNVYIADAVHNLIRKVSVTDGIIRTVAGTGLPGFSRDGGLATDAQLNGPAGLSLDARGNIYIADTGNNRVRVRTTDGRIHTVAGVGRMGTAGDGGPAKLAELEFPISVAVGLDGRLYIGTRGEQAIRVVD